MLAALGRLARLVEWLREDLKDEWEANHYEHCGCDRLAGKECQWVPPLTLQTDDLAWLEERRIRQGEDAPYLGKHFRYGDLVLPEGDDPSVLVKVEERGRTSSTTSEPPDVIAEVVPGLTPAQPFQDPMVDMLRVIPDSPVMQHRMIVYSEIIPEGSSLDSFGSLGSSSQHRDTHSGDEDRSQ